MPPAIFETENGKFGPFDPRSERCSGTLARNF